MIHQYKLNGHSIVIDVYSGSVHVVDDVAYDIIRLFCVKTKEEIVAELLEKYGKPEGFDNSRAADENCIEEITEEDILECYEDVAELKNQGKLFTEDEFRLSPEIAAKRRTDIKALCLHIAHACDLTCSYCFEGSSRVRVL